VNLGRGQFVRVVGRFDGHDPCPELVSCRIVEKGPDTLIRISAELLAREYTSDQEACTAKYRDRTLFVVGIVSALKKGPNGSFRHVVLRGDGQTAIECRFNHPFTSVYSDSYNPGDQATLVGITAPLSESEKGYMLLILCDPTDR
jgi:hypothetical protein